MNDVDTHLKAVLRLPSLLWMNTKSGLSLVLALAASAVGCAYSPDPTSGSCTLSDNGDGSSTLACPDGTKTFLRNGAHGTEPAKAAAAPGEQQAFASTIEGSFTLENAIDVADMAGVERITGDLFVTGKGLTKATLPSLREVGGTVHLTGAQLESIAFPKLNKIGGLHVEGTRLLTIEAFGNVTGKVGKIHFRNNARLGRLAGLEGISGADEIMIDNEPMLVNLDGLTGIEGHVKDGIFVFADGQLTSVAGLGNVDSVGSANGLVISANPKLAAIALSSLKSASTIGVHLGGVASVTFPSLTAVEQGISIAHNDDLKSVTMPQLVNVGGAFHVDVNPTLESLQVPELRTAGTFHLFLDPALVTASFRNLESVQDQYVVVGTGLLQCRLDAWAEGLAAAQILVADNASGSCD
jgi:hypothetical protein